MSKSDRRKASKHEDGADMISNLADHILLLILSGLPSTEEIIRTSILSRRWKYLWTSIHSLDLVYRRERKPYKFKEFVDYVLINRSADLDSFRVSHSLYYSMSTIERWIHATVMRNVKQLDLSFPSQRKSEDMVMPHSASLEVLRLCFMDRRLILPSFSGFPALRVLMLKYVELSDSDSVKDFLESCPMLEDLTLEFCKLGKLDRLCISCPKLKKLRILYSDLRGCFKINCPKLVFLELAARLEASKFIFERLDSLKEARIDFKLKDIQGLFPEIFYVESLTTKLYILNECIDAARDPALPNLKTLVVSTSDTFTVQNLIQILKHCPKLESLNLTIENVFDPTEFWEMDVTETASVLTPDVKWLEFFDINGEKPKLAIYWYPSEGVWMYLVATWGNKSRYS